MVYLLYNVESYKDLCYKDFVDRLKRDLEDQTREYEVVFPGVTLTDTPKDLIPDRRISLNHRTSFRIFSLGLSDRLVQFDIYRKESKTKL